MNKLSVLWEDITKLSVEAIVNAANSRLLGVDGSIHRAAGPDLLEECRGLGGCDVGDAKITKAYNIKKAKYIIHTVGPQIYDDLTAEDKTNLRNCYWNSLELAKKHEIKSIAFPCISTGVYSFPPKKACEIAVKTTSEWLEKNPEMELVVFCCFLQEDYDLYKKRLGVKEENSENVEEKNDSAEESKPEIVEEKKKDVAQEKKQE